jgi:arsenate reductase (glutaredoxin)
MDIPNSAGFWASTGAQDAGVHQPRKKLAPQRNKLRAEVDWFALDSPVTALAHPILINRPIVVTPKGVRLCRPSEAVLDLLDHPAGSFVKEDGEAVTRAKS